MSEHLKPPTGENPISAVIDKIGELAEKFAASTRANVLVALGALAVIIIPGCRACSRDQQESADRPSIPSNQLSQDPRFEVGSDWLLEHAPTMDEDGMTADPHQEYEMDESDELGENPDALDDRQMIEDGELPDGLEERVPAAPITPVPSSKGHRRYSAPRDPWHSDEGILRTL